MKRLEDGIIISNDIYLIITGCNALKFKYIDKAIIVPSKEFIDNLREEFKEICEKAYQTKVTFISEEDMTNSMNELIDKYKGRYPIVSMDEIYIKCDNENIYSLDCTRLAGSKEMVSRLNPRDPDGVRKQVMRLAYIFRSRGTKEIILLDDVIFSGSVIKYISDLFNAYGIKVVGACAAISSEEGYEMFSNLPEKVSCGYLMSKNVIDEVCERDYFYGIAQSGMAMEVDGEIYKTPYILPFGDPVKRASIPEENQEQFSKDCIRLALKFWMETERLSNREIMNYELPERINNTDYNEGVVKTLKKVLK